MHYLYETEDGDTFRMCQTCVFLAEDTTGEFCCPRCHQWYVVRHPDGEAMEIVRLYDRDARA